MQKTDSKPADRSAPPLSLDDLIKKAGELDMMPQVARRVLQLVADQNSNANQLAEVLEKDANITTRILKIANSAFYGLRREVKSINQAIVILGFRTLRSMVVASSSKSLHKRFGIAEQLMWDQSIGAAIGAKLIAQKMPPAVGELAFIGGLLHNVGKTIMNNECPHPFTAVMELVYNDGYSPIDAEVEVFKYSNPEVGFRIIEKWGLPVELGNLVRYQQYTKLTEADRTAVKANADLEKGVACVELAAEICRFLGIGSRVKDESIKLSELESAKVLNVDELMLETYKSEILKTYTAERSIFQ